MNIEQAKRIPITDILDKLGLKPQRKNGHEVCYFSPLRAEKTPSLWVNTHTNLWKDFGDVRWGGGDGITLAQAYLDTQNLQCDIPAALRWLQFASGTIPTIRPVHDHDDIPTEKSLVLRQASDLKNERLIAYGYERGIPKSILCKYFGEATVFNNKSQKRFYALAMRNESKGYELRTPYFKGCLGRKYITFIRGTDPNMKAIHVFEGAFDFASVVTQQNGKPLRYDSLILHSLSNLKKGSAYIKGFGYSQLFSWMDNDKPGQEAIKAWSEFCKTEENLVHVPMNRLYFPYKDANAAHMAQLEL